MFIIYNKVLKERKRLEDKIEKTKEQLKYLPEGKLVLCFDGRHKYKWFHSDGHTKKYIMKKNRALAEKLAYKRYLTEQLALLGREKAAAEAYLSKYQKSNLTSNHKVDDLSEYQNLLSRYFTPSNQELEFWMQEKYDKNQQYQEQLIHRTAMGINVRSKSESFILNCLHMNNIPYRYEAALKLGNITYYPDFTIRHPKTGEIFYWEHFGMMDKRDYAKSAYSKLEVYHTHGIIPGANLIVTFETKDHPLSMEEVEQIVERYFL